MAKIEEAFKKVLSLEFSAPANALHYNSTERGYTYMGIYEVAHPQWEGWSIIKQEFSKSEMSKASSKLYYNNELNELVIKFYKKEFWDKMRLDEVISQNTAEELFVFGVNAGIPSAVKAAQKVVGVSVDGVIGSKTISALNSFDEKLFSSEYDKEEINHYESLVAKNPAFKVYINGWRNRALAV